MLKRLVSVVVAALVGLAASGCGLISSPGRAVPAEYVEMPTVTPAAAALVGQSRAEQAAHEMTAFTLATSFNPALLDPTQQSFTAEELSSPLIQETLVPGALPLWNALVDEAAAGNRDAQEEVKGLQMFALDHPTWQVNPDGKIVHSQAITHVVVDILANSQASAPGTAAGVANAAEATPLAGGTEEGPAADEIQPSDTQMLKVAFTHVARLRFTEDKYPFEVVFTRDVEYHLVPSGSAEGRTAPTKITVVTATPVVPARPGSTATAVRPTTVKPTTVKPTTVKPTTVKPTTVKPTTVMPTTVKPTTVKPTTVKPTTVKPTTVKPTTVKPTTVKPTTVKPTTQPPPTKEPPTKEPPTKEPPTTEPPTTEPPTKEPPTTEPPTTEPPPIVDPLPSAAAALVAPREGSPGIGASSAPSSGPAGGRLWQIAAFFGPYSVDTVALPR